MTPFATRRLAVVAFTFTMSFVAAATAGDWPRFRGPNGTGVAADATIPTQFKEGDGILWKVPLPGKGNSSPVISRGKLFLQTASDDGHERQMLCLDAVTGKTLWSRSAPGGTVKINPHNSLASSTPAVDGERVFVLFWDGKAVTLSAFDFQGNPQWKQELGSFASQHGAGTSPMEFDGRVFVNYDQDGAAVLLAFDAKTGKPAWRAERKGFRASYSVPLVRETPAGKKELVIGTTTGTTGYDPQTGAELWNWVPDFSWREKGPLRTVASPVAWKDMVVVQYGDGDGSRCITAIRAPGNGSKPELVWEKKKLRATPYVPCMLVADDRLYCVTDDGYADCYDIRTGKEIWARQRLKSTSVFASPVLIDGKVYAPVGDEVFVFAAAPAFKLLADNSLRESISASPAVADGRLYIRGEKHLFCVGKTW
jgi:outer membrane protein assembly factor BamB